MDKLQAVDEKFSDIRKIITINSNINIRIRIFNYHVINTL